MKTKKILVALLICISLFAFAFTASAEDLTGFTGWNGEYNESTYEYDYCYYVDGQKQFNKWLELEDGWYYVGADGCRYSGGIYTIGSKLYYFHWDGSCAIDERVYDSDPETYESYYCYALPGSGQLVTNNWHQSFKNGEWDTEDWAYYGADGKAYTYDSYKIGGTWYYFDSEGRMLDDEEGWWYDQEAGIEYYLRARKGGALYVNEWYKVTYDGGNGVDWYYYGEGGKTCYGYKVVNGVGYFFSYWGYMVTNDARDYNGVWYTIDEDGRASKLNSNDWTYVNGEWYCVQDDQICTYGIYTIGGKTYAFDYAGRMYSGEKFNMDFWDEELDDWSPYYRYYAREDGTLVQNTWMEVDGEWYYFGSDFRACQGGMFKIGPYYYFFDDGGCLYQNTTLEGDGKVYSIDSNGRTTEVNGWFLCPYEGYENEWMCALYGQILRYGVYQFSNNYWAFDYEGILCRDRFFELSEYDDETGEWLSSKRYIATEDGSLAKPGWITYAGSYYLVTEDRSLYEGWYNDTYFLRPAMEYCDIIPDGDRLYAVNTSGVRRTITTPGFYSTLSYGTYYVQTNGTLAREKWVKDSGYWYYFDENGLIVTDTTREINGVNYFFLSTGRMADFGWVRNSIGEWYWAASSGALYTGKDSAGYAFDDTGRLVEDGAVLIKGVWYVTDGNGKVAHTLETGWYSVGNTWYLALDGELVTEEWTDSQGRTYIFGSNGKMLSNCFYWYDGRNYIGEDGVLKTGWFMVDGKWYYASKGEENGDYYSKGSLYGTGAYIIGGQTYLFMDYILQQNATNIVHDCYSYSTDSEGVVTKFVNANGWSYYVDQYGEGCVYYYRNGNPYTGWVGDYYIDYGNMLTAEINKWNGKYYYLGKDGKYVRNGWFQYWEDSNDWNYANADGTICYNEWKMIGGKWYYFNYEYMLYDEIAMIDGKWHEFDENGVWLGEVSVDPTANNNKKDGWVKIDGEWYFSMAGQYVYDEELYIDGAWYYFNYNGTMMEDSFRIVWTWGTETPGYYYYGKDGKRANYTGWKTVNGKWVYFNSQNIAPTGLVYDGSNYYYQDVVYNREALAKAYVSMQTGYHVIYGKIYHFNSSGILDKTISTNGWIKVDGNWYYFENGSCITGCEKLIGGVWYAFDGNGVMVTNEMYDGHYYGASGARVTTQGWIQIDGGDWIYVYKGGTVARDGVHLIGGKEYAFYDCCWVG